MAALDLLSPHFSIETRPKKRRRLRLHNPVSSFCEEVTRLQLQLASQFLLSTKPTVRYDRDSWETVGLTDNRPTRDFCAEDLSLVTSQSHRASRVASPPWHADDEDGHFNFRLGENLTPRYKILQQMGQGTFGRVLECWDRDAQEMVAIKVVRSAKKYRDAARIEVDILCMLAEKDEGGSRGCVQIRNWFDYREHICIVCEKLGPSLFDFLRTNNYRPFSIDLVQEFGRQILGSVAFMHSLRLIHTDLKPENVLLACTEYTTILDYKNYTRHPAELKRVPKSSRIKLIDFGSATYDSEDSFSVVSTRHYRAPEVILGLRWSFPCDIWSVGCILVELCSGEALFQTHENVEHLAMMERVLGPIPSHIIKRSMGMSDRYFRHGRELNWPDGATSRESVRAVRKLPKLRNLIMQHADHSAGLLIDLLEKLLKFDPEERPTAREALNHPFFSGSCRRTSKEVWDILVRLYHGRNEAHIARLKKDDCMDGFLTNDQGLEGAANCRDDEVVCNSFIVQNVLNCIIDSY